MRHFDFSGQRGDYLRRSTPGLPEDMRRLIDEAVTAGRVTHVPAGVSGLPQYRYVGDAGAGGFMEVTVDAAGREKLVPIGTAKQKNRAARAAAKEHWRIGQSAAVAAQKARSAQRQATIWAMHEAGRSAAEIGVALNATETAIEAQLKIIRKQLRAQGLYVAPPTLPERVAELRAQGMSNAEVACAFGVSRGAVRDAAWRAKRAGLLPGDQREDEVAA